MSSPEVISIDGVDYVRSDSKAPAEKLDGLEYVIVRTYSAGVFAGYLESRDGKEAVLKRARRLWYWDGAASLSQLANEGVKRPGNCKFAQEVPSIVLTEAIEIIPATEVARKNIAEVKVWQA